MFPLSFYRQFQTPVWNADCIVFWERCGSTGFTPRKQSQSWKRALALLQPGSKHLYDWWMGRWAIWLVMLSIIIWSCWGSRVTSLYTYESWWNHLRAVDRFMATLPLRERVFSCEDVEIAYEFPNHWSIRLCLERRNRHHWQRAGKGNGCCLEKQGSLDANIIMHGYTPMVLSRFV